MDSKTIATLVVTVTLAFIGYIVKYLHDVAVARRKDRLERVNLQLRNLYGPLYALDRATRIAWEAFSKRYPDIDPHPRDFNSRPLSTTKEGLVEWRLWMSEVFMPFNLKTEKLIVENADLIIENEMPTCLLQLVAHIVTYKPVIKKWQSDDYSEYLSMADFPTDLRQYLESSYSKLKNEQAVLIGKLKGNSKA